MGGEEVWWGEGPASRSNRVNSCHQVLLQAPSKITVHAKHLGVGAQKLWQPSFSLKCKLLH